MAPCAFGPTLENFFAAHRGAVLRDIPWRSRRRNGKLIEMEGR